MFIAYSFLSNRDFEKLKTPLDFSCQDASKYVSGDLEKSIFKFDPKSGLLTQILRSYRKYVESKFKKCFPTHWSKWNSNEAGTPWKSKKVLLAPPTIYTAICVIGLNIVLLMGFPQIYPIHTMFKLPRMFQLSRPYLHFRSPDLIKPSF